MSWDDAGKRAGKGPFAALVVTLLIGGVGTAGVWAVGSVFGWFGEAARVARQEFGPKAVLQKYEWFKDAAAQLDKKRADIEVYGSRLKGMESDYDGVPRREWDRTDKEQMSIWQAELAGVKASYNSLAAEYNAQMSKFNWSFANAGELPAGATEVLPSE